MGQTQRQVDKPLPSNVPAEKAILGAVLLDNALMPTGLDAEDFSLSSHSLIFLRMNEMIARGESADLITLVEELVSKRELQSVGELPTAYIASLSEDTMRSKPSVKDWARIVKAKSLQRRLIQACQDAMSKSFDGEPGLVVIAELREKLDAIEGAAKKGMR